MTFRLELFVDDLVASTDFYGRVLGFVIGEQQADGYTPLTSGDVSLSLNLRANLPDDHPIQAIVGERLGRGIELVLEVNDIEAMYKRVRSANWPLAGELQPQPWSLTDFRVLDPDGYYWRITTRGKDGS
ncbi:MAG: VOC family protein [Anaerolineaceae bacterium]|nr:VOC family protein [Anaerolineaceae bacterium]